MAKRSSKTPIDEIADEAIRRIREEAQREKNMHAVEQERASRRGPQPGRGGRPRKGSGLRISRTFTLDQQVLAWVETQRSDGESFSEAIERLLKMQMKTLPM